MIYYLSKREGRIGVKHVFVLAAAVACVGVYAGGAMRMLIIVLFLRMAERMYNYDRTYYYMFPTYIILIKNTIPVTLCCYLTK